MTTNPAAPGRACPNCGQPGNHEVGTRCDGEGKKVFYNCPEPAAPPDAGAGSETPRVDAALGWIGDSDDWQPDKEYVTADFARTLEREARQLEREIAQSRGDLDIAEETILTQQKDAELTAARQWRPICEAPKDGIYLVYMPEEREENRIHVAVVRPNFTVIGGLFSYDRKPATHFQHLPPPPTKTP